MRGERDRNAGPHGTQIDVGIARDVPLPPRRVVADEDTQMRRRRVRAHRRRVTVHEALLHRPALRCFLKIRRLRPGARSRQRIHDLALARHEHGAPNVGA